MRRKAAHTIGSSTTAMGWETRARGGRYYYRKRRVGGRVVSEHVCRRVAPFAAIIDEDDRQLRAARRRVVLDELEAIDGDAAESREWYDLVEAVARVAIEAAGYHRHDRGRWRKRRVDATTTTELAA